MAYRLRGRYGYDQDDPFLPTIHTNRIEEPYRRRKPSKIFTCPMGELFDPHIPTAWVEEVLRVMDDCARHTFQLLTKRYYSLLSFDYPDNLWLGVSQDCKTTDLDAIRALKLTNARVKFVSFEPLLGPLPEEETDLFYRLDWIIVGAQTGPRAVTPEREWVEEIIHEARIWDVPIFLKDNLIMHDYEPIREWPEVAI